MSNPPQTVLQPSPAGRRKLLKATPEVEAALQRRCGEAAREEAIIEAERAARVDPVRAGVKETLKLAKARGEEKPGAVGPGMIVRDGLMWLLKKRKILAAHYDAGVRFREDWERAYQTRWPGTTACCVESRPAWPSAGSRRFAFPQRFPRKSLTKGDAPVPTRPSRFNPHPTPSTSRDADRARGSASDRGYTHAWRDASKAHLNANPLCRYCQLGIFGDGPRTCLAVATDHLYPQRKFAGVFWEGVWWVSTCTDCHNAKQVIEKRGKAAIDHLARRLGLPTLTMGVGVPNP